MAIWVITAGHCVWMTKPATMPVRVGVKPELPCNSDSVEASDEPGFTRLGQIDCPNFSIEALIESLPDSFGVLPAPPASACAGLAPRNAAARAVIAGNDARRIEPEERIDFTRVTLGHKSHVSGTVG